ncbi:hypothetical protein RFI_08881 [Reticulomyxa filosa]|uniref:Reverse transcriptase/retrotransposon-derived protein RNase H-like domain-containing protein n=1 Tax=Reticulomyxa filosa TaxID=46433 RepID=X6NSE0_RETFI|nr:hypothetical protein RFI_08881 [Reticulomyxa filosa]|eukprot:ETO28252.1 hypothetical protein RFI_08881 [Reticulomyxa filosa]
MLEHEKITFNINFSVKSCAKIVNNIEQQIKKEIQQLINKNQILSYSNSSDIGQIPNAEIKLELKHVVKSIKQKTYIINNMYQKIVEKQVSKLEHSDNTENLKKKLSGKRILSKLDYGLTIHKYQFEKKICTKLHLLLQTDYTNRIKCNLVSQTHIDLFRRFDKYNLRLAMEKCKFFQNEIVFFGHVISSNGASANPSYINKVLNVPKLKTKKQLKRYLQDKAFEKLKEAFVNVKLLRHPRQNGQFILQCDASNESIGAALLQNHDDVIVTIKFISKQFDCH